MASASDRAVCRIINQNSCGSGTICGHMDGGSLVLTNAHVAGTTIGRTVKVLAESINRQFDARVIRAAYSDRVIADWAILLIPNFRDIAPVYLSKNPPDPNENMWTKGFPRCQPFAGQTLSQFQTLNNGVLLWQPNSIGGQSGSGVVDMDDQVVRALLTWSWTQGGRAYGAGQLTSHIYRQNMAQEVVGYEMMPGLIPLPNDDYDFTGVDRGYDDPVLEHGFHSLPLPRGIQDLPIWAEDIQPPPPPPPGGDADAIRKVALEALRKVREDADAGIKQLENGLSDPIDPGDPDTIHDTFGL